MHVVEVGGVKPAVQQHADELLEHHAYLGVDLDQRPVAHKQGTHCLQRWNLEWKIERCDHGDRPEWPAIATRLLAGVVARIGKTTRQEAHAVASEVLKKDARDPDFVQALLPALGHDALRELGEVLLDLGRR